MNPFTFMKYPVLLTKKASEKLKSNWVRNNMATNMVKNQENPLNYDFATHQYLLCNINFPVTSTQNGRGKRIVIIGPECV